MRRHKDSEEHVAHLRVSLPHEERAVLRRFADDEQTTEGEALRRAIALLALARREKLNGRCLAVATRGENQALEPIAAVEGI